MLVAKRPQRTWNKEKSEQSVDKFNHTASPALCELLGPTRYSLLTLQHEISQQSNMMTITIMMIQWPTALKHTVQYSLIWHTRFDIQCYVMQTASCSMVHWFNIKILYCTVKSSISMQCRLTQGMLGTKQWVASDQHDISVQWGSTPYSFLRLWDAALDGRADSSETSVPIYETALRHIS